MNNIKIKIIDFRNNIGITKNCFTKFLSSLGRDFNKSEIVIIKITKENKRNIKIRFKLLNKNLSANIVNKIDQIKNPEYNIENTFTMFFL